MLAVTGNVRPVAEELSRLEAEFPAMIRRCMEPGRWREPAREVARRELAAVARPAETPFIEAFTGTVTAAFLAPVLSLGMRDPTEDTSRVAAQTGFVFPGDRTNGTETTYGEMQPLNNDHGWLLNQVLDWVEQEKRWDVLRDGEKTMEHMAAKAEWIGWLLLTPHLTPNEQEARDRLMPHILAWIEQRSRTASGALPAETAEAWLMAVLLAWEAWAPEHFSKMMNEE